MVGITCNGIGQTPRNAKTVISQINGLIKKLIPFQFAMLLLSAMLIPRAAKSLAITAQ